MAFKAAFRKYLRVLTPHDPFAALISKNGKWFVGRTSSDEFEIARLWKKVNKPKAKDCWYNAQTFVSDCGDFKYFEGYVLFPGGLPIEHAWVAMDDGRAVDFTLEAMEKTAKRRRLSVDTSESLYLGVQIPLRFIREQIADTNSYQSLAEAYYSKQSRKFALVKGDRAPELQEHAQLWSAWLEIEVTAADVAAMMILLKLARTKTGEKNIDDSRMPADMPESSASC